MCLAMTSILHVRNLNEVLMLAWSMYIYYLVDHLPSSGLEPLLRKLEKLSCPFFCVNNKKGPSITQGTDSACALPKTSQPPKLWEISFVV